MRVSGFFPWFRVAISLLLAVSLSGCSSWRVMETPLAPADEYGHLRVYLKDGSVMEMKQVQASGDTLSGLGKTTKMGWREEIESFNTPVIVTMGDVSTVKLRQPDTVKTVLLVVGTVLVVALVVGAAVVANDLEKHPPCFLCAPGVPVRE